MRLGTASCLLIFNTLRHKTLSEFVSSSDHFYLSQEEGDNVDSLGDGGFNFGPIEDRVLEVKSTIDVKADLRGVSQLRLAGEILDKMKTSPTHRLSPKADSEPLHRQFSRQDLVFGAKVL